jgi:hypothetical protein
LAVDVEPYSSTLDQAQAPGKVNSKNPSIDKSLLDILDDSDAIDAVTELNDTENDSHTEELTEEGDIADFGIKKMVDLVPTVAAELKKAGIENIFPDFF